MTEKIIAAEHHAAAAFHHEQAACHHRAAARAYRIGKDYAQAANQAFIAHGHAWHAIEQAGEASRQYAGPESAVLAASSRHTVAVAPNSADLARTGQNGFSAAEHHIAAAFHHEQAARHHRLASKHCDGNAFVDAAHDGLDAHVRAKHAVFHDNEAAKHHVAFYAHRNSDRLATPAAF